MKGSVDAKRITLGGDTYVRKQDIIVWLFACAEEAKTNGWDVRQPSEFVFALALQLADS